MPTQAALFLLFLSGSLAADVGVADAKNRPVTKVINLLKDMLKQMEKEGEEDEDIYDKMGCWCVTGEKEKTKSIADAQARIVELQATIEESTADAARLNAEVANLQSEIAKNTDALGEATALREKQLAGFNVEEKESLQSITSVKGAVQVLSKQHSAFLQLGTMSDSESISFNVNLKQVLKRHQEWFSDTTVTPHQRKELERFVQQSRDGYSLAQTKYEPASGAIFGILKQMKEDFEINLEKSRKEEESNVADFNALKAAKTDEIADAEALVETKTGEAAAADERKANGKTDLEDTQNTLDADNKYLSDLKVRCANMDNEFEERTKARQMEMQAVGKALEFLSSDEAHDLFTRTFNPALLQRAAASKLDSKRRRALSNLIKTAAKEAQDPRLSALAVSARLDAFEEVKKTIKGMIDKLLQESQDDIKHKDYCIDEFNTNEVDTTNKQKELDGHKANIEDLAMTIDELMKAIETLKAEIAQLTADQEAASVQRTKANAEFQATVSDQKATQKLLAAALKVLKGFYDKAALVQVHAHGAAAESESQAPPPGFKKMEKSAAGGGVMGMMQKIIDEAKELEAEAMRGEEAAQEDFEEFTKDTTESLKQKNKDVVNKSEEMAKAEGDRVQAEADRDNALQNLEELAQGNADLHKSCDFLMKNFDARKTARDGEVEALKKGLALFSGASFAAFLQHA